MSFTARGSFSLAQELFGSRVEDIQPSDLPLGASPRNNDVFFLPGGVFTRPALTGLDSTQGSGKTISIGDFRLPSGDWQILKLNDDGNLWAVDSITGSRTFLFSVSGICRQHFGIYGDFLFIASSAMGASPNPWATMQSGFDVPVYWNGTDLKRVTSDAPPPPSVSILNVPPALVAALGSSTSLSISSYATSGEQQQRTWVPPGEPPDKGRWVVTIYWTTIIFTCTTAPSTSLIGQTCVITGLTGTFANQVNATFVIQSVNGDTFTVSYYSTVSFSASAQSGTATVGASDLYLTRIGNYVKAYLGASLPANFTVGFWISFTDTSGNAIQGPLLTISSMSRNALGIVTVNLASPLTNLPPGTVIYITPPSVNYAGTASVTNGSFTVTQSSGSSFDGNFPGNSINLGGVDYVVISQSGSTVTLSQAYQGATGTVSFSLSAEDFGSGSFQTVYEVLSPTQFTYQSLDTDVLTSIAGGSCYIQWSPMGGTYGNAAQITNTGSDTNGAWIEWFQLGPDSQLTLSAAPQAAIVGQASPGTHQFVLFYENEDGAQTSVSTIVSAESSGNGGLFLFSNIAIGPAGTTKRIIAATLANGDLFFYLTAASTLAQAGQAPSIVIGTEINDNISVSTTIDFSDAALSAATENEIDVTGNDLFSQIRLDPVCGFFPYSTRLLAWGELNNRKNIPNLGFDAGYYAPTGTISMTNGSATGLIESCSIPVQPGWAGSLSPLVAGATFIVNGITLVVGPSGMSGDNATFTQNWTGTTGIYPFYVLSSLGVSPPYWNVGGGIGDGSGYLVPGTRFGGFRYAIPTGGNGAIQQGVYQDVYGGTILEPSTTYILRFIASVSAAQSAGTISAFLESLSTNYEVIGSVALSSVGTSDTWVTMTLTTPASEIPSDLTLTIYLNGTISGATVYLDEVEMIPENQPVLDNQLRASYATNPFGFDGVTGYIAPSNVESPISALGQLRNNLYIVTEQNLRQGLDDGTEPSTWPIQVFDEACGCCSPWAITGSEDWLLWGGRHGIRFFDGNPETKKISQELSKTWETIRWDDPMSMWITSDAVQRQTYVGIKTNSADNTADLLLVLNYRLADSTYNVPDPIHISTFSGKMLATDLGRKWTLWYREIPCGAACISNPYGLGIQKNMLLGGSLQRRIYSLDVIHYPPLQESEIDWNVDDDDWGGFASEYVTSFFFPRDAEMQPLLGSYRKLFSDLAYHATGVGYLNVVPYLDSLGCPGLSFPIFQTAWPDRGYDFALAPNVVCERMALGFSCQSGAAFGLTHLNVSAHKDLVFPERGAL